MCGARAFPQTYSVLPHAEWQFLILCVDSVVVFFSCPNAGLERRTSDSLEFSFIHLLVGKAEDRGGILAAGPARLRCFCARSYRFCAHLLEGKAWDSVVVLRPSPIFIPMR